MKTLELNFEQIAEENIGKMIEKMKAASPVLFTHTIGTPSMRNIISKPEYSYIKVQVRLTFTSDSEACQFMDMPECRTAFDNAS